MRLAVSQTYPVDGDIAAAFIHIEQCLNIAARARADMVVLPELFLPGYNCPDLHAALSQSVDGEWITRLRALATQASCGLVIGWAERDGETVYNAASAIGSDGQLLAHYRKIQLFGQMEDDSFQAGCEPPPVFDYRGWTCGLLICYDIEFSGHINYLAKSGAELVLVPTANPAGYSHVQRIVLPARAYENRMSLAYANYCGTERELSFCGQSVVIGPDAGILAAAGNVPALLVTEIPPISTYPTRSLATLNADYRPVKQGIPSDHW